MSALPTLLRAGATLQLLVDQRAHRRFVEAPFFGRMASCDRTLGVLARRVPKPILVYACLGTEDPERFRFVAPKVIDPEELSGLSALEITTRVNLEIESLIRMAPEQYLWLHDRFRDRPASAPTPQSALS
jgi:KDO2-lipid IV(A) lauroyltransferase